MNKFLNKLCGIGAKNSRMIVGLMSGTSLDGLDIALCKITGSGLETELELIAFETIPFEEYFKNQIRAVFAKKMASLEKVCLLNAWVAKEHAKHINAAINKWQLTANDIDLLASHGQTIYHAPQWLHQQEGFGNATLQIGDGDHLAVDTGIITISDFRQKHIAAGGEGAPLAVYGDYFIFSKKGEDRIMLNIGGIANFTYLPGNLDASKIFSTDTGPGNTLMDAYAQKYFNQAYDQDAAIAAAGTVSEKLLAWLKDHSFFKQAFPKTTGPELFNLSYLEDALQASGETNLTGHDVMATLNRFSALTIVEALQRCFEGNPSFTLYASGGGMHNRLLMESIQQQLPGYSFHSTDQLAINPDAKEAILFALLANECVAGGNTPIGNGSADIPSVSMGKISFPG